jgi:4-amino-4-deoxy-L-arabinose transferase-like glycosyltransferase
VLLVLLIAAFALRAGLLLVYPQIAGGGDQGLHYVIGVLVSKLGTAPLGWWPPGYEVMLGSVFALFGSEPVSARLVQVLLSTATVGLLYGIVGSASNRRAARIAAALCAFFPGFVAFSHYLYGETLFIFLLAAAFYAYIRRSEPRPADLFLAGVLMGLSVLTRSVILWFLPGWIAWEFLRGRRRRAREIGVIVAVSLMVVAPWTVRNVFKYDALLLVDGTLGRTAYLAYSGIESEALIAGDLGLDVLGGGERTRESCPERALENVPELPAVNELVGFFPPAGSIPNLSRPEKGTFSTPRRLKKALNMKIEKSRTRARLDLVAQQRCEIPRALAEIGSDPIRWVGTFFQRLYVFWGPSSYLLRSSHDGAYPHGPFAEYGLMKGWVLIFYIGIMAAALLALGQRTLPLLVEWSALFAVYNCTVYSLSIASTRYRLPVMLFTMAMASIWLARPSLPEGRARQVIVGLLLLTFLLLSAYYVQTVLP